MNHEEWKKRELQLQVISKGQTMEGPVNLGEVLAICSNFFGQP
jgi:hypothetical protein